MTTINNRGRMLALSLLTFGIALSGIPSAAADPGPAPAPAPDPAIAAPAAPAAVDPTAPAPGPADMASAPIPDGTDPLTQACTQFNSALDVAASNYEDFAYDTAGTGNSVNYGDPIIADSNVRGRTALRQAAATAWSASTTPGIPPNVSSAMQTWSVHATKLIFIMGLRGGGDSLNNTANDLNTDASNAQNACAIAHLPQT